MVDLRQLVDTRHLRSKLGHVLGGTLVLTSLSGGPGGRRGCWVVQAYRTPLNGRIGQRVGFEWGRIKGQFGKLRKRWHGGSDCKRGNESG